MRQLVQKLKNGIMSILDVPPPALQPGTILVKNHYSLISAGTEGHTVSAARKNLILKAKERPQQVEQVIDTLLQQGPVQTYRSVMKKLDTWSPLGYSSSGLVIDVAPDVTGFAVGDRVACGGAGYANHAEIICVPVNLCVKLPTGADLKRAAYHTLGAIALQGIRQADLKFGETTVVIGLGLIGQLTCLLLQASGVRVAGIDLNNDMLELAKGRCADEVYSATDPAISEKIYAFTNAWGADAVIITASSSSLEPVNLSGQLARQKGKVVIVGNVPTGFDREPFYYRKELDLRMSCAYGPGRYDPSYEEKGIDYPVGYVRWTENRNMRAFQDAVGSGKINLDYLTTHIFELNKAPNAYELILNKHEPFLGMLIEYEDSLPESPKSIAIKAPSPEPQVSIAFIGAGSYAQSHLLPNIPRSSKIALKTVLTSSGSSARSVAERFGFESCTTDQAEVFQESVNTVFIATRHNTHANYVIKALECGKNVFVEKPLCLTEDELSEIKAAESRSGKLLMVGFNRRFSPLVSLLKEKIGQGPMSMLYRINAGTIPSHSWIQDRNIGGGRIIGEVCHFIDLLSYICGSVPLSVYAAALPDPDSHCDTLTIVLKYGNGSIANISYYSNGSKGLEKEYMEVFSHGMTAVLNDFRELNIYGNRKSTEKKLLSQNKGQAIGVASFINAILNGRPCPISFNEIIQTSLTTFKVLESLRMGQALSICE